MVDLGEPSAPRGREPMPRTSSTLPHPAFGFRRASVADQVALALGTAIREGQLANPLPGEASLALRLGISRPSVRAALEQLRQVGLVEIRKGARARILAARGMKRHAATPRLAVVSPSRGEALYLTQTPVLMHLHSEALARGFEWEAIFDPKLATASASRWLRRLAMGRRDTCWVLYGCPVWLQRWFAESRLPSLVFGTGGPGISLPAVDIDSRSVGWHAAGMLARHGHRRIALVLPPGPLAGDLACRDGFLAYFAQRLDPGLVLTQLALEAAAPRHLGALRSALAGRGRPTALFVVREYNALTVYHEVLALGLSVPDEVSVVARDSHPLIDAALPQLTRYQSLPSKRAALAVRLAQTLLAGGASPPRSRLFTPQFYPGRTLGPAPKARVAERSR